MSKTALNAPRSCVWLLGVFREVFHFSGEIKKGPEEIWSFRLRTTSSRPLLLPGERGENSDVAGGGDLVLGTSRVRFPGGFDRQGGESLASSGLLFV